MFSAFKIRSDDSGVIHENIRDRMSRLRLVHTTSGDPAVHYTSGNPSVHYTSCNPSVHTSANPLAHTSVHTSGNPSSNLRRVIRWRILKL